MPIYINNILQKKEDIQTTTIVEYNNDNTKALANSITLQGAAYQIVKDLIIDNPEGRLKEIPYRYVSDCCNFTFLGVIRGDTTSFRHGACTCEVSVIESNSFTKILDDARTRTLAEIMDTPSRRNVPNVRFKTTVSNVFTGGQNGRCPSPFILDIINAFCEDNGLTFDAQSILNQSPYNRLALFHCPTIPPNNQTKSLILENLPIWTIEDLLNSLATIFNAKDEASNYTWYIDRETLVLYFDRKDLLKSPAIIDISSQSNIELECTFVTDKPYAAIDIQWTPDSYDSLTQDKQVKGWFNGVFSWNPTNNDAQTGLKRVNIPFAACAHQSLFFWGNGFNVLGQSGVQAVIAGTSTNRVLLERKLTGVPRVIIIRQDGNNWYVSQEQIKLTAKNIESDFYSIDNPNNAASYKRFDYELTFTATCEFIENFNQRDKLSYDGMILTIESARINLDTKEVSISGHLV